MNLPEEFLNKMKELLKEEYDTYQESFLQESLNGLRVNTLKLSSEEFEKISPFLLEKIPWTKNGYYYQKQEQPAKHPFYYAGLYYIQEPSAMLPASAFPIAPGEKVLDLCAAPGGKSTELAAKLKGKGVLVTNDISNSRAKALLKNIELFGIKNAIVVSEAPEKLAGKFPNYFDKILIDAPCSGEGMFRKDKGMIKNWSLEKVEYYSKLQKEILDKAIQMLKPGGMLFYSTCTFSPEENEQSIAYILEQTKDITLVPMEQIEGFDKGKPEWANENPALSRCHRLWPFRIQGEGHFAALLKKQSEEEIQPVCKKLIPAKKRKIEQSLFDFLKLLSIEIKEELLEQYDNKWYLLPEGLPDLKGLRILRSGLFLGETKKNRFEPSQALAMCLKKEEFKNSIDWDIESPNVIKYLKGETIQLEEKEEEKKGWQLVCVNGYPLGFGKAEKGMLKNKYYPGWRWM